MFQLINSLYLFALLGLLVPIAIHLWNRRKGKVIKVGSIQWLQVSTNSRFSSIKFHQWPLFLLRALLIILLSLLLAGLYRSVEETDNKERVSWILIEPRLVNKEYLQQPIDSLQRSGYEIRLLRENFPLWEQEKDSEPLNVTENYWSLLKAIEYRDQVPQKVIVYSHSFLKNFAGRRPSLSYELDWLSFPQKDQVHFIASALLLNDSLQITLGTTGEAIIYFTRLSRSIPKNRQQINAKNFPPIFVSPGEAHGTFALALENSRDTLIVTPSPEVRVSIYYDEAYKKDQKFIAAALKAIGKFKNRNIAVQSFPADQYQQQQSTWTFWLTDKPVPTELPPEKVIRITPSLTLETNIIYRGVDDKTYHLKPLFQSGGRTEFEFLPEQLITLLFSDVQVTDRIENNDHRRINDNQLQVNYKEGRSKEAVENLALIDLHFPLWLLLLTTFLVERSISGRRKM